jgi:hypothetical protein
MTVSPHSPHIVRTSGRACADFVSAAFSVPYIYSPHSPHIYIRRERLATRRPFTVLMISPLERVRTVRIVRTHSQIISNQNVIGPHKLTRTVRTNAVCGLWTVARGGGVAVSPLGPTGRRRAPLRRQVARGPNMRAAGQGAIGQPSYAADGAGQADDRTGGQPYQTAGRRAAGWSRRAGMYARDGLVADKMGPR